METELLSSYFSILTPLKSKVAYLWEKEVLYNVHTDPNKEVLSVQRSHWSKQRSTYNVHTDPNKYFELHEKLQLKALDLYFR